MSDLCKWNQYYFKWFVLKDRPLPVPDSRARIKFHNETVRNLDKQHKLESQDEVKWDEKMCCLQER